MVVVKSVTLEGRNIVKGGWGKQSSVDPVVMQKLIKNPERGGKTICGLKQPDNLGSTERHDVRSVSHRNLMPKLKIAARWCAIEDNI